MQVPYRALEAKEESAMALIMMRFVKAEPDFVQVRKRIVRARSEHASDLPKTAENAFGIQTTALQRSVRTAPEVRPAGNLVSSRKTRSQHTYENRVAQNIGV
jgi:hypothetical protein